MSGTMTAEQMGERTTAAAAEDLARRSWDAAKAGAVGGFAAGAVALLFGAPWMTPVAGAVGGAVGAVAVELSRSRR